MLPLTYTLAPPEPVRTRGLLVLRRPPSPRASSGASVDAALPSPPVPLPAAGSPDPGGVQPLPLGGVPLAVVPVSVSCMELHNERLSIDDGMTEPG